MPSTGGLWHRLGLGRPELRAWALYDWANSAFITVVVSGLFPPWFAGVASAGAGDATATVRLGYGTAIALAIIAVMSPVLGAIGDRAPVKKTLLAMFTALGVLSTAALVMVGQGDWLLALILFGLANIGANGAFVFYDIGGGVLLAGAAVVVITPATFGLPDKTAAVHVAFLATAVWWTLFAIPLLRNVREPDIARSERVHGFGAVRAGFRDVAHTYQELRRYPQAARLLLAFLVYNDGIGTIYRMATSFGREIGLPTGQMITALLIVQLVGVPATFAFGAFAHRIGTRRAIFVGIALYGLVSVLGYRLQTATDFFLLAGLVGLVQGGTQALSRSLFASMVPRHRSSEFFGLFAVFEKFAGIFGPLIFAVVASTFDSSREAILSLIAFFAAGALLLWRVDVAAGQRTADEANRAREAAS
jgi:UMF1 family MFS transporter